MLEAVPRHGGAVHRTNQVDEQIPQLVHAIPARLPCPLSLDAGDDALGRGR